MKAATGATKLGMCAYPLARQKALCLLPGTVFQINVGLLESKLYLSSVVVVHIS